MPASVNKIRKIIKRKNSPYPTLIGPGSIAAVGSRLRALLLLPSPPRPNPLSWSLDPAFRQLLWRCCPPMCRRRSLPCLLAEREREGRPLPPPYTGSALPVPPASPSIGSALLEPRWRCCSPRSQPRWRWTRSPAVAPCSEVERSRRHGSL